MKIEKEADESTSVASQVRTKSILGCLHYMFPGLPALMLSFMIVSTEL
jgi:hypothetical protein